MNKNMIKIDKKILKKIYQPRPKNAKKYDFGLLLVIGGSNFYSGSPALSALAAFRAGVDMVRIVAPKRAADIIASFSPDLAAYPLDEEWLSKKSLSVLLTMTESAKLVANGRTAVVLGGGLGRSQETQEAVLEYLKQIDTDIPVVIDADAIYAVANQPQLISGRHFLFTPHSYEFFVLTGQKLTSASLEEKIKIVETEARRLKTTILLKGETDIVSNGQQTAINQTGNAYMTVGGCGDTLAGICGALLARGVDLFIAAQAGAYLNGRAGEMAAQQYGEGLTATDLIEAIPRAIKK